MKKLILIFSCCTLTACSSMSGHQSYTSFQHHSELSDKLDSIRDNTQELIVFMNDFPKGADLHNHASGASFAEDVLLFANKNDYFFDTKNMVIVSEDNGSKSLIPMEDFIKDTKAVTAYRDLVSSRGWYRNTTNGSDHFFNTFGYIGIDEYDAKNIADALARNYSQNIRYVEFMKGNLPKDILKQLYRLLPESEFDLNNLPQALAKITPYLNSSDFAEKVNASMSEQERVVDAILRKDHGLTITGEQPDILVGYISQLYRSQSPYHIFITAAANFKASQINKDIVATNMVQDEAEIRSLMYFDEQMQVFDFLWKALDKPVIALHAGELVLRESPVEAMRTRISDSITLGHALRIGHGIAIAWEDDPAATLKMMAEQDIAIEICLSSNDMILDIKGEDHPLPLYLEAGVPVTLNTDDEGVARSNLTWEYIRAIQEHNLDYEVLKEIAKNGLEYSFLDGESIYDENGQVMQQYRQYIKGDLPTRSQVGEKAYLQILHERDFIEFEKEHGISN